MLDLLEAGRTATELDISTQTIYTWRSLQATAYGRVATVTFAGGPRVRFPLGLATDCYARAAVHTPVQAL